MSNASLILPFLPSPLSAAAPTAALFSFQNNPETTAPAARNTILRSNGPVTPRTDAAHEANFPAMMATRASPVKANPNVSPRYSRKFVRPASPLTHASGAVNNSDRAHPTMARPANRTQSSLDLMVATPMEYSSANASVPAFRPYLSVACPIEGPRMAVAAKPVRNILETSAILASTPPNTLDLYAGTTYGPLIQYPHRSNQNAAKNLACIDLTFAGFSSSSSAAASADLLSLEIPSPPVFAVKRSNVLKPTAAIASTIRSESNRTTGSEVTEAATFDIDSVIVASDVRSPPARGMARTTDLAAAAAALPAARDIDTRTLVVEILLPLPHVLVIAVKVDAIKG
mmetsp:Transcript_28640/g.63045  ORF Transcript_28640/g.63045 Transcript_28640/m.63045 type:complete len:343 (+) Transcript_28640:720-1748(+)